MNYPHIHIYKHTNGIQPLSTVCTTNHVLLQMTDFFILLGILFISDHKFSVGFKSEMVNDFVFLSTFLGWKYSICQSHLFILLKVIALAEYHYQRCLNMCFPAVNNNPLNSLSLTYGLWWFCKNTWSDEIKVEV